MHGLVCDACGETLLAESDVRYILEIRGYAAYDPLEIGPGALRADFDREMERLIAAMESQDAASLEADVHQEFRFDLCPACWRRFRSRPLAGATGGIGGDRGADATERSDGTRSTEDGPDEDGPDGDSAADGDPLGP